MNILTDRACFAAHVNGKILPVQYLIRISNETGLIRTLTGTSTNGLISADWNLRDETGHVTTNSHYDVTIDASWPGGKASTGNSPERGKCRKGNAHTR
jgi:hypothetical protein